MLGLLKPCLVCGELTPNESRCDVHEDELTRVNKALSDRRRVATRPSNREQGRDTAWRRLSERARRMQPWCTDCGKTSDLTTDHTPEAWAAKAAGRSITLRMVDVVCRGCNNRRGEAKPGSIRYEKWANA